MTRTTISTAEETTAVGVLRDLLDGEVVLPRDTDWDAARQAWNLSVDQRPAAVVFAESAEDIVAVVDYARRGGRRSTPR